MLILNGKEENPSSKNIDKPFNCDATGKRRDRAMGTPKAEF